MTCEEVKLDDIKGPLAVTVRVHECALEKWDSGKGHTMVVKVADEVDKDGKTKYALLYMYGEKAKNFFPMFQKGGVFRFTNIAVIPPRASTPTGVVLLNQQWALSVPNNGEVTPICL